MSLGVGAYKVGGAGQCSSMRRRYPWQPCERPPPGTVTLNNSVEYLPTQYLPSPHQEGGRDGKNQSTNWHANSKLLQQHFAKNCKTAYISHEVPLLEASGHPYYSWETDDQHCIKVNFAEITFSHIKYCLNINYQNLILLHALQKKLLAKDYLMCVSAE